MTKEERFSIILSELSTLPEEFETKVYWVRSKDWRRSKAYINRDIQQLELTIPFPKNNYTLMVGLHEIGHAHIYTKIQIGQLYNHYKGEVDAWKFCEKTCKQYHVPFLVEFVEYCLDSHTWTESIINLSDRKSKKLATYKYLFNWCTKFGKLKYRSSRKTNLLQLEKLHKRMFQ